MLTTSAYDESLILYVVMLFLCFIVYEPAHDILVLSV